MTILVVVVAIRMVVTILVVPLARLLLALELALTLEFTLSLVLLLSSILILIPRILCLGRRARYQRDTTKQQQSQECSSKFFDAVHFLHCSYPPANTIAMTMP